MRHESAIAGSSTSGSRAKIARESRATRSKRSRLAIIPYLMTS
jgi:hypothetical protein